MTMTQKRAPKGGQIAINGEFYEGGKFLPSTQKGKGKPYKKTGKREIEPYKWEMQPTPESVTVLSQIGVFGVMGEKGMTINPDAQFDGENYFFPDYISIKASVLTRLIKMFNQGDRWIDF